MHTPSSMNVSLAVNNVSDMTEEELTLRFTPGLSSWLINAFNGEWHRIANPKPVESAWKLAKRFVTSPLSFAS